MPAEWPNRYLNRHFGGDHAENCLQASLASNLSKSSSITFGTCSGAAPAAGVAPEQNLRPAAQSLKPEWRRRTRQDDPTGVHRIRPELSETNLRHVRMPDGVQCVARSINRTVNFRLESELGVKAGAIAS
jgi:hypothetical protein